MPSLRSSPVTRPEGADAGRGLARQDARPAADVQHPVPRSDRGDVGELGRPLGEDGGNEVPLIGDGSVVRQLPRCCSDMAAGASFSAMSGAAWRTTVPACVTSPGQDGSFALERCGSAA